jgi:hypothetical protein
VTSSNGEGAAICLPEKPRRIPAANSRRQGNLTMDLLDVLLDDQLYAELPNEFPETAITTFQSVA